MDDLRINHDSFFGKPENDSERQQTTEDAAARRAEMFRERRYMRELIDKSAFPRAQRAVMRALIDHWFYHRSKAKDGVIHPGRERLAKKARCTIKTVSRALNTLRALGVLDAVASLNGYGQEATRYRFSEAKLRHVLGGTKCPTTVYCETKSPTKWRDKMSHSLNDGVNSKNPSQDVKFGNVVPFIGKGC